MLTTLGIVEACCRTPAERSLACRRLGGKSILEWVVRRVTDAQQIDGVMVLTTAAEESERLRRLVPLDVPVYAAHRDDVLGCVVAALEEYRPESAVLIRADCPFADAMLIDRLVTASQSQSDCEYVGYSSRDGRPTARSPVGMFAEWFRTKSLLQAARSAVAVADRESPTRCLYAHPERFRVHWIPAPEQIDREDVRLTVDIEEDWDHMLAIFDALGPEELDWRRIANLLNHQPALRRRMADLNRAHARTT
jgi:spore coat polysaccharide biosynthesis protein SpsF